MKITRNPGRALVPYNELRVGSVYRNESYSDEMLGFFIYTDEDTVVYLEDGTAYSEAEAHLSGDPVTGPYDAELVIR